MVFTLFTAAYYVGSVILCLIIGLYSIIYWNKNKERKYSFVYLGGGIGLILIFLLVFFRIVGWV